jgi:ubiquinone/menaquinone biosynthesis C-methylase UbiE
VDAGIVLERIGLEEGEIFLDAGSGDGYFSVEASRVVGERGKVYALDIHKESLEKLREEISRRKIKNIEIIEADLTQKLPFQEREIDIYFIANVLHGFDPEEMSFVLWEARRVLKDRGKIVILEFKKIEPPPGPPLEIRLTPAFLETRLLEAGFESPQTLDAGQFHVMIVAKKGK